METIMFVQRNYLNSEGLRIRAKIRLKATFEKYLTKTKNNGFNERGNTNTSVMRDDKRLILYDTDCII